jgi:hypothetical protein
LYNVLGAISVNCCLAVYLKDKDHGVEISFPRPQGLAIFMVTGFYQKDW